MRSPEIEIAAPLPPPGCPVTEAERYTYWLATHHYENFHVVSWMLPRHLRRHFYNVYAYCRWADDLGDEVADPARALELLNWWESELNLCYEGRPSHPVFVALAPTIREFDIPAEPFHDLLTAFRQDQTVHRYATWEDLLGYCRYSANPVGRLVLFLCGYRDAERQRLSDATCTALQLANFWQDLASDAQKRDRVYLPADEMKRFGVGVEQLRAGSFGPKLANLMRFQVDRTEALFKAGEGLPARLGGRLGAEIRLTLLGGRRILEKIRFQGYNTLARRPKLGAADAPALLWRFATGSLG